MQSQQSHVLHSLGS